MWTYILAAPEPDQNAVRGGDDRVRELMPVEVLGHLRDPQVRSEGRGGRLHDILDRRRRVAAQRIGGDEAQEDALRIDDDAHLPPAGGSDAVAHITDSLLGSTRRDVTPREIRHARRERVRTL